MIPTDRETSGRETFDTSRGPVAPLVQSSRLSGEFERCRLGLTHVREELDRMGGMIQ